jgi:ATP-binding cassette subfamily C protein
MKNATLLLSGEHQAYRLSGGDADLYAVQLLDGLKYGRLHYIKTAKDGEIIPDYAPVDMPSGSRFGCLVKLSGPAELTPVVLPADRCADFREFASSVEKTVGADIQELERKKAYNKQATEAASERLAHINTRLSGWQDNNFSDSDELIEAIQVLCAYLNVKCRIPQSDLSIDSVSLSGEILYLSGVRHKAVTLGENWWKSVSGAMLGFLTDGTPVALLPHRVSGYTVYNPKSNKQERVTEKNSAQISTRALATYRTFPSGKIGLKEALKFIFGEHMQREIFLLALCSFLAAVLQIVPPIVSAQIFDVVVPEHLRTILFEFIMILIAFAIANIGFSIIMNLALSRITTKIEFSFSAAIWDRLLNLPLNFFSRYTTGTLLQKIKSIEQIKKIVSADNIKALLSALFSFINIIVLWKYNSAITPYVLLLFVLAFAVYLLLGHRKMRLNRRYELINGKLSSLSHQMVAGIQRIKTSAAEERAFDIWSEFESEKRFLSSRVKMIDNALSAFQQFFKIASPAFVYFMVAISSEMAIGNFVAYIATFLILQKSLLKLLKVINYIPDLVPAAENLAPILNTSPEYSIEKTIPKDIDGTLELNHVIFRYGEFGRTILQDISFRVEAGQSIGITGLSGSGKTTLLGAIMGFYPLAGGKIFYGGYDLDTIDIRYLRRQLGVVLQNGEPIVGSIYDNVTDNNSSISTDEVFLALHNVGLTDCISAMPHGIHTRLEHTLLSDGEKQRLLIAKAIVANKKYLLLDESTSHINNHSQDEIMRCVMQLPTTKVIIAQRLSAFKYCDKVFVLEQGHITDSGTYEQIVGKNRALST